MSELTAIEEKHYVFWQKFLGHAMGSLTLGRRIKLTVFLFVTKIWGEKAMHLLLEATEVNSIRKHLQIWNICAHTEYESMVRAIIEEEFGREDAIIEKLITRKINPERIRNIFLGFNDGLVELLGAISGFYAAFANTSSVVVASITVAAAGAISMGAGAYVALGSQNEISKIEAQKLAFKNPEANVSLTHERLFVSGATVAISYFIGALVPLTPILFGSKNIFLSLACGGILIILVSAVLAFLSGMNARRRIATNLVLIIGAVVLSYGIGIFARNIWGISI
ncbi:MAG: hypothetical protein Greene041614_1228 [Parcubacteria group bacterium Greene0416_14]|nr:MAG: hypothetical protein Greene041614_1228 [Parcubacteria group bacterium Greene0416_14]